MISELGNNFIVGLNSTILSSKEEDLLKELKPLGIILFKKNILQDTSWKNVLERLLNSAREIVKRDKFIISIDHEGGRVHRLREPVTHFPSARNYRENSFIVGQKMGEELKALGFNLNYAPVVDVHTEENNTVIGDRSFSNKAGEIALYAKPFLAGMNSAGVLGCIKHFPGHGRTIKDSHYELPVLDISKEEMEKTELLPYRNLLSSVCLVMTAHVIYPKLDKDNPATLSDKIINGILRKEYGYNGAVITDDLEMKALAELSPSEKAKRAVKAGVDILLEANPSNGIALEVAREMAIGLSNALETGEITIDYLNESRRRIKKLTNLIS